MTRSNLQPAEALETLEHEHARQNDEWERVKSELRSLAEEHGEGFAVSDEALRALDELTKMDTVPAPVPLFGHLALVKG